MYLKWVSKKLLLFILRLLTKITSISEKLSNKIKKFQLKLEVKSKNIITNKDEGLSFKGREEKTCHFSSLFITHKGEVFPCCMVWKREDMKIGNISDENLLTSIETFYAECSCERYKLRKGTVADKKDYAQINLELSLNCQGKCAMCAVGAPDWRGQYDHYGSCTQIIDQLKPKEILVQGGEILVQKKSLEWIARLKESHSDMKVLIVTNGNAGLDKIDIVEKLFDRATVSMVGFQPETYRRIMGMDLQKTIKFVEELAERRKVAITLKYLSTALNLHESNLFLKWAISINPNLIYFSDANVGGYINAAAPFHFWNKIYNRTGQEIKSLLLENKNLLAEKNIEIQFTRRMLILLGLTKGFEEIRSDKITQRYA
jgi:MoaA/NifB/PqqE/SkfB family radical SAM enzyme